MNCRPATFLEHGRTYAFPSCYLLSTLQTPSAHDHLAQQLIRNVSGSRFSTALDAAFIHLDQLMDRRRCYFNRGERLLIVLPRVGVSCLVFGVGITNVIECLLTDRKSLR